jgi:hypothetical protein
VTPVIELGPLGPHPDHAERDIVGWLADLGLIGRAVGTGEDRFRLGRGDGIVAQALSGDGHAIGDLTGSRTGTLPTPLEAIHQAARNPG